MQDFDEIIKLIENMDVESAFVKKKNQAKAGENIHSSHRQRMRDKVDRYGFEALSDHEKLEFLLFYTIPRANTNEQGHRLLEKFGSFSAVLDASQRELCSVKGVGPKSAAFLNLIPQLCNYYINDKTAPVSRFETLESIGEYISKKFIGLKVEKVYFMCLDARNKCLHEGFLEPYGEVNVVKFNYLGLTKTVLQCDAVSIVLAHNHPGGIPIPSPDDIEVTNMIRNMMKNMSIECKEHFVVCESGHIGILHA